MQTDADIAVGQAARKSGRYDLAVASFRRAEARSECASEARLSEFGALRELDISRHLVGRLLRRIDLPETAYKGFSAIDPPLADATVRHRLDELAESASVDEHFQTMLEADRLARHEPDGDHPAPDESAIALEVRVGLARRELGRGRPHRALALLGPVISSVAPSAAVQAVLGKALWVIGDKSAALNAFNLSLLYLSGTTVRGRLRFQTAYKDYRIVFFQGQFYAIPDWRDPILEDNAGEARLVAHRVPRRLRHALRRILPARLIGLIYRAMTLMALRGEVRLDQMVHSPDLLSVLRSVDQLHSLKR